jgi:hypothetical protein
VVGLGSLDYLDCLDCGGVHFPSPAPDLTLDCGKRGKNTAGPEQQRDVPALDHHSGAMARKKVTEIGPYEGLLFLQFCRCICVCVLFPMASRGERVGRSLQREPLEKDSLECPPKSSPRLVPGMSLFRVPQNPSLVSPESHPRVPLQSVPQNPSLEPPECHIRVSQNPILESPPNPY